MMNASDAFKLNRVDYTVRSLQPADAALLQALYDRCADFTLLVEGEPVSPTAAGQDLQSVPAGKSLADKCVFGIFNLQGEIVGVLDALRDYPEEAAWWVGLLMLAPAVRGQGLGRDAFLAFSEYVRWHGAKVIMLGVVEENKPALEFWQKMGFSLLRKTEPRLFGKKMQVVYIFRRSIDQPAGARQPA